MVIEIKNLRNGFTDSATAFRVDRKSVVGNPYFMCSEKERDKVCEKYKLYFKNTLLKDEVALEYLRDMYRALKKYGHIELYCWCAPKRCHAETIKEFLLASFKIIL